MVVRRKPIEQRSRAEASSGRAASVFPTLGKCDHEIQIACGSRLQGGPRASGELFSLASASPRAIRFAKEDSGAFEALALIYRTTWPGKKLNSSNGA